MNILPMGVAHCLIIFPGMLGGTSFCRADDNLARNRPCQVFSSSAENDCSPAKLTDGQTGELAWSSKAFAAYQEHRLYPEFVILDLGRNCKIDRVVLHPRGDGDQAGHGFPEDFSIQVCDQGDPWRVVVEKTSFAEPKSGEPQTFDVDHAHGRFIQVVATRLRQVGKTYHFQLAELEVFGQPADHRPLATIPLPNRSEPASALVRGLQCEHGVNPVGIDAQHPRFDWIMDSPTLGDRQTAYRILVSSSRELLLADRGDLWDSGFRSGDQSVAVRYAGLPLKSGQKCCWKVMVRDRHGRPTKWSAPSTFIIGKLNAKDWRGQWIGADLLAKTSLQDAARDSTLPSSHGAVYLRREVNIDKAVKRATAFICGLGHSELYIEGAKVGTGVLTPGFTTYDKRVQYLTHDVTDYFDEPGRQAIGVVLVDGWYGLDKDPWVHKFENMPYVDRPKVRMNLHLEHEDGSESVVVSDSNWKWSRGEITRSWICEEDVDLRQAQPDWNQAGFDDRNWRVAREVEGPAGQLVCQKEIPTRICDHIKPVSLSWLPDKGVWSYDFGREFTGRVRFRASGAAGTQIEVSVPPPLGSEKIVARVNRFTLAGTGREEYRPRFCYNAISRIEIQGTESPPQLDDLDAEILSGVGSVSGSFRCSNPLLNWLHESARRTQMAYDTYLPNDPTREYKAWMEDPQNMFCSAVYLYDSRAMYERWQHDMLDCQAPDGNGSGIAPGPVFDDYNSPWWGGCLVWTPWHWYLYYGDSSLLAESYEPMKRYVDCLGRVGQNDMQDWGLGDWQAVEETPKAIVNTPAYYLYARIVAQSAQILGHQEDAARYSERAKSIRKQFNSRFFNDANGIFGERCTQAGQALPLALELVPAAARNRAENALLKQIEVGRGHIGSGFVATPYVLQVLSDVAPEVGHQITTAQDAPSWYAMTAGSDHDLMQEAWNGRPAMMPSLGGNIAMWNMQSLGGIRPDPFGPGFKKFLIRPNIVGDLHWVECWFDSVYGRITSNWRRREDELVMDVTVPVNTTATIYVPATHTSAVSANGRPATDAPGVKHLRLEGGRLVLAVESGTFRFKTALPPTTPPNTP